jgi:cytoskeletal protein RodZ
MTRLLRRAGAWIVWSRRNLTITVGAVMAVLVLYTALSILGGVLNARREALAAADRRRTTPSSSPALATPTTHPTPTSLLELAAQSGTPSAGTSSKTTSSATAPAHAAVATAARTAPANLATAPPLGQAAATAQRFIVAFARTQAGQDAWWAGVRPLLSDDGVAYYEGTAAAEVPIKAVTGRSVPLPAEVENAVSVKVPTNDGVYVVDLVRSAPNQPWLVERAVPAGR